MWSLLDFLYPKSCCICSRYGFYLCDVCKKLLQRNLPECYVCRRISKGYKTHERCKGLFSFDSVFVGWRYNKLSSGFLRRYKYNGVYDIESVFKEIVPPLLRDFSYVGGSDTLVLPVPVSKMRLYDRGFNQVDCIARIVADCLHCDYSNCVLENVDCSREHKAFMDREERESFSKERFRMIDVNIGKYKNIVIVDDVITTGSTLREVSMCIKKRCRDNVSLHAFCLFRGKPYYL